MTDSNDSEPISIGLDDGYAFTKLALANGRLAAIPSRARVGRAGQGAVADATLSGMDPEALGRITCPVRIASGGSSPTSYAQIAEVLGIPVGTVKSRVFHAVRKLRAELDGEPGNSLRVHRIGGKIVGRIGGTHATQSRWAGRRAVR